MSCTLQGCCSSRLACQECLEQSRSFRLRAKGGLALALSQHLQGKRGRGSSRGVSVSWFVGGRGRCTASPRAPPRTHLQQPIAKRGGCAVQSNPEGVLQGADGGVRCRPAVHGCRARGGGWARWEGGVGAQPAEPQHGPCGWPLQRGIPSDAPDQAAASPLPRQGPSRSSRGGKEAVTRISCCAAPSAPSRLTSTSPSPGCSEEQGQEHERQPEPRRPS